MEFRDMEETPKGSHWNHKEFDGNPLQNPKDVREKWNGIPF